MVYVFLVSTCVICGVCLRVNGTTSGRIGSSEEIDEMLITTSVMLSACAQEKGQCTASACTLPEDASVSKTTSVYSRDETETEMPAGPQHKTHIANGTGRDLEAFVEYFGKSFPLTVPTDQFKCVETNFRKVFLCDSDAQDHSGSSVSIYGSPWNVNGAVDGNTSLIFNEFGKVRVTIRGPYGQSMREIQSDRSIVVRTNGTRYEIHLAKYGKLWQIE